MCVCVCFPCQGDFSEVWWGLSFSLVQAVEPAFFLFSFYFFFFQNLFLFTSIHFRALDGCRTANIFRFQFSLGNFSLWKTSELKWAFSSFLFFIHLQSYAFSYKEDVLNIQEPWMQNDIIKCPSHECTVYCKPMYYKALTAWSFRIDNIQVQWVRMNAACFPLSNS